MKRQSLGWCQHKNRASAFLRIMFGVSSYKDPIARSRRHLKKHQVVRIWQSCFQGEGSSEFLILQDLQKTFYCLWRKVELLSAKNLLILRKKSKVIGHP